MIKKLDSVIDSRHITVGALHNESQETMFDTALSTAVDNLISVIKLIDRAKEAKETCESVLIDEMKKNNVRILHFEGGFIQLEVEEKEKVKVRMDKGFEG